eukprot:Blabericola_migrator_1__12484@NODE_78_length_15130_cov_126_174401_g70_i0_p9_GENE_NODE_78_length_15130_cov_126_174401_g70_i0NODE_78_length_15130_cov_126_174401_g70_i0_p9_ORF_typecomplete_len184_score27_06_NODE_78_length_15130_cov_126_174401_g70_i090579608
MQADTNVLEMLDRATEDMISTKELDQLCRALSDAAKDNDSPTDETMTKEIIGSSRSSSYDSTTEEAGVSSQSLVAVQPKAPPPASEQIGHEVSREPIVKRAVTDPGAAHTVTEIVISPHETKGCQAVAESHNEEDNDLKKLREAMICAWRARHLLPRVNEKLNSLPLEERLILDQLCSVQEGK